MCLRGGVTNETERWYTYGTTQEGHAAYSGYVDMGAQEGFLGEGTGFLIPVTLFFFTFLSHSHSYCLS